MEKFQSPRDTYLVERSLGEGGMGVAYLVKSQHTGEQLFLKQLRLDRVGDWKAVELFEREAKILAQLRHPNIPAYIDYFPTGERSDYALVQSFIEGQTLQEHISQKLPLSIEDYSLYLQQALAILSYLHSLVPPVVHRDITPRNLIISGKQLYLVDFGSVKVALGASTTMTTVGTFGYMSPEQIVGQAEPVSDLYSLGMSFIALASLTDPSQMPLDKKSGRPSTDGLLAHLPSHLRMLLQDMVKPGVEERVQSAKVALARLREPAPTLQVQYSNAPKPVQKNDNERKEKRAKRLRTFAITSAVFITILSLGWLTTLRKATGEIRTLGGWFSGHGSTISAITGTFFGDYSLLTSRAYIKQVAFGPNGLVASGAYHEIILWDANTGAALHRFDNNDLFYGIEYMGFTQDGKTLVVGFEQEVILYDTETFIDTRINLNNLHHKTFRESYVDLFDLYAPSRETMLGAFAKGTLAVIYDLKKLEPLFSFTDQALYTTRARGAFSGDGKLFAVCLDTRILVFEVAPHQEPLTAQQAKYRLETKEEIDAIAFSKDGIFLAAFDQNGGIIWDMRSGTTVQDFPTSLSGYSYNPVSLAFSDDGKTLAAANEQEIRFYDVASGGNFGRLKGHAEEIQDIAFSPDGKTLLTGAWDQLLKLWTVPPKP